MIKVYPERLIVKPLYTGIKLSLETIKREILTAARRYGLPIEIKNDEVKPATGLAAIGIPAEPCIVIYNTQHRNDYYNYIISIKMQGSSAYLAMYLGGSSKNYRDEVIASNSSSIFSQIAGNRAKTKKISEHIYYDEIKEIINAVLDDISKNFEYYVDRPTQRPSTPPQQPTQSSNATYRQSHVTSTKSSARPSQPNCQASASTSTNYKSYTAPSDSTYHIKFDKRKSSTSPQASNQRAGSASPKKNEKTNKIANLGASHSSTDTSFDVHKNIIVPSSIANNGGYVKVLMNHIEYGKIEDIFIEANSKESNIICFTDKGRLNPATGKRGILYLIIRIADVTETTKGLDIIQKTPILKSDADFGTVMFVSLPHISVDKKVKVTIRPGVKNNSLVRLKGCGNFNFTTKSRGDFYLEMKVIQEV